MRVRLGNLYTKVLAILPEEDRWLDDLLAFPDERARWGGTKDGKRHMYNALWRSFPTGYAPMVKANALKQGVVYERVDGRAVPCAEDSNADLSWLRDYQLAAVQRAAKVGRGILWLPTGCHAPGQGILMFDGTVRAVEQVQDGNLLMGPDSEPRRVLRLVRGRGQMYRIVPRKGSPWIVNEDHMLTLVRTRSWREGKEKRRSNRPGPARCAPSNRGGVVVDVSVREWLGWSKWKKHLHKLYRVGVGFEGEGMDRLPVDPYLLGVLLGDGSLSQTPRVTSADPEIVEALRVNAERLGLKVVKDASGGKTCPTYLLSSGRRGGRENPLTRSLRDLGLWGHGARTKSIPHRYKTSDRTSRLALLAGLLDTDGSLALGYYDYGTTSPTLAEDVAFVARSLGFFCKISPHAHDSWRVSVCGEVDQIPCLIARKRAKPRRQKKEASRTGFSVEKLDGEGVYCGFTLDGDGRYLLDDFTVTHNSGKSEIAIGLVRRLPCRWLFLVHRAGLMHQMAERYTLRTGLRAFEVGDGAPVPRVAEVLGERLVVATFQTVAAAFKRKEDEAATKDFLAAFDGIIIDEAHTLPSNTYWRVSMACKNAYYRFGMSGTPLARGDRRSTYTVAALGPVVCHVQPTTLIDAGVLTEPTIRVLRVHHKVDAYLDWHEVYSDAIVADMRRNLLVATEAFKAAKPCLVFVQRIEHGEILLHSLQRAGVKAEFVWGTKDTSERQAAVRRLEEGTMEVLVCSVVFQEGVDIPSLRSVIVATGGKSQIAALQRIGRGMRVDAASGKTTFDVVDFFDSGHEWLEKHSRARVRAYQREGYKVTLDGATL